MKTRESKESKAVIDVLAQISDVLAQISPEQIAGDLMATFGQMIWTVVLDYEKRSLRKRTKELNPATHGPSFELLFLLWEISVRHGGKIIGARPNDLAKIMEMNLKEKVMQPRVENLVRQLLELLESDVQATLIQQELLLCNSLSRHRSAIKKSMMEAAKALKIVGLIDIKNGTRGKRQNVTKEIILTEKGLEFMRLLLRYSISTSADRYPANVMSGKQEEEGAITHAYSARDRKMSAVS
jgi:hypothetical protein